MTCVFFGYEFLWFRKLETDCLSFQRPSVLPNSDSNRIQWMLQFMKEVMQDDYDFGEMPQNLCFLATSVDKQKERFRRFLQNELNEIKTDPYSGSLLLKYLNCHVFTELHLDTVFKYGENNNLPRELFQCSSVRLLSLKYNHLYKLSPDVGRMANLEQLVLTNNKLQNKSLPYTLTFCTKLRKLFLDNNLLDALPGFLLKMKSLETVHRHGNHNYFKSTFMWYHTDVNERILRLVGPNDYQPRQPRALQFWAARSIVGSKMNFFADERVPLAMKNYISNGYGNFSVCGDCKNASLLSQGGFKVITFKNPYLGNSCVPFQHFACSIKCARIIEIPSRNEQIATALHLDEQYDNYVTECHKQYHPRRSTLASYRRSKRVSKSSSKRVKPSRHDIRDTTSDSESEQSDMLRREFTFKARNGRTRFRRYNHPSYSADRTTCVLL